MPCAGPSSTVAKTTGAPAPPAFFGAGYEIDGRAIGRDEEIAIRQRSELTSRRDLRDALDHEPLRNDESGRRSRPRAQVSTAPESSLDRLRASPAPPSTTTSGGGSGARARARPASGGERETDEPNRSGDTS